jgi:hypothetical protein
MKAIGGLRKLRVANFHHPAGDESGFVPSLQTLLRDPADGVVHLGDRLDVVKV